MDIKQEIDNASAAGYRWSDLMALLKRSRAEIERLEAEVRMERETRAKDRQEFDATTRALRQALSDAQDSAMQQCFGG
jgi:DUF1365 family protein